MSVTAPRFNLQNGIIDRDWFERSPDNRPAIRKVAYYPETATIGFRHEFVRERLVLGRFVLGTGREDVFEVPRESRPLALEARSISNGEFSLTDQGMMRELGHLAGSIARLSGKVIGGGEAEQAFGLVDFVAQGERQIYLLPGSEQLLREPRIDAMYDQVEEFSKGFDTRFGDYIEDFRGAYQRGLEG
jgi:hypothetical protein